MSLPSPARGKGLAVSILSLSLLTVMAGAAVAPALGVIQAYFSGTSQTVVQLIISIPALFIVITNLCFPALSRRFSTKTLVLGGLLLYTVGGCAAGLFDQIALVLVMRALVGVGVGILMPLSTGLLTFYYPPERQAALMGYASAMNQMGGVIATLLAGLLSQLNWRASFLVYLLGLLSIVLCLGFLPSDRLDQPQHAEEASAAGSPFRTYFVYILAMFLLMSIFFVYPANFALETTAEGAVPAQCIAVIMAGADLVAFVGGLLFVHLRRAMGRGCKLLAPVLFLLGFLLLTLLHRLCQRRGHPLSHLRGIDAGGQIRRFDGHAPALRRHVPGAVSFPPAAGGIAGRAGGPDPPGLLVRGGAGRPLRPLLPAYPGRARSTAGLRLFPKSRRSPAEAPVVPVFLRGIVYLLMKIKRLSPWTT